MGKTTITIRQHGDMVYFLNSEGFQKGSIKRTLVLSEKNTRTVVKYFVVCDDDCSEYGGLEKHPNELFDSGKEMIAFYQNKFK